MRTQQEVESMLKDCRMKRDYWKQRLLNLDHEEWEGQQDSYADNFDAWSQRVKTLEYVLGLNDII